MSPRWAVSVIVRRWSASAARSSWWPSTACTYAARTSTVRNARSSAASISRRRRSLRRAAGERRRASATGELLHARGRRAQHAVARRDRRDRLLRRLLVDAGLQVLGLGDVLGAHVVQAA